MAIAAGAGPEYLYRPSLAARPVRIALEAEAISLTRGSDPPERIPYAAIDSLHRTALFRTGLSATGERCVVRARDGRRIAFSSFEAAGVGRIENRLDDYTRITAALTERVAARNPAARLHEGSGRLGWLLALGAVAATVAVPLGALALMVAYDTYPLAGLVVIGLVALTLPQMIQMARLHRPRSRPIAEAACSGR